MVIPAAVTPLVTNPVEPEPAAPEVLISYTYPFAGAGEAAGQERVAVLSVIAEMFAP